MKLYNLAVFFILMLIIVIYDSNYFIGPSLIW